MEGVFFETRENYNNRRFQTRTVKIRLLQDIQDPVLDFIRIVTYLGDQYNYWDDTVVSFGGKDTTGKEFYVNRFEGKPLMLSECRDPERMGNIIYTVCALILNSNQSLKFAAGATMTVTFTKVPPEWIAQIGQRRPL